VSAPRIVVEDGDVVVSQGDETLFKLGVEDFTERVFRSRDRAPSCGILPPGVRAWIERGDSIALAVEIAPGARSVNWIRDDSPEPFGSDATYDRRYLSFPFVEILLVLHDGELTGQQQLYYRRESLEHGEELLLPNLLNVSPDAYAQKAWLCLANLGSVSGHDWPGKIRAVVQHTFSASFNLSSEKHEGSSYWRDSAEIDPRVATVDAWHEATVADPYFALDLPWKDAGVTVTEQLGAMLDNVTTAATMRSASDLAARLGSGGTRRRRRRCSP